MRVNADEQAALLRAQELAAMREPRKRDKEISRMCNEAYRKHEFDWCLEFEFELWKTQETLVWDRPQTRLYTIFDGLDAVKIGVARSPESRIADLQIANYRPLKLFTSCPATEPLERYFHKRLADWRLRGEWFALDSHVLAAISLIASMSDWEADVPEEFDASDSVGFITSRFDEMEDKMRGKAA